MPVQAIVHVNRMMLTSYSNSLTEQSSVVCLEIAVALRPLNGTLKNLISISLMARANERA
jgi:hypothetical protein